MIAQQQAHCVAVQQQSASMVLRSQSLFARCCRRPMHFSSCSSPRVGVSSSAARQAASASRGPRHAVYAGAVAPWKVQHSAHGAAIGRSAFRQHQSRLSETRAAGGVDGLYRNWCSNTAVRISRCLPACIIDRPTSATANHNGIHQRLVQFALVIRSASAEPCSGPPIHPCCHPGRVVAHPCGCRDAHC